MLPDNPLAFIQRCVREEKIKWTYHVNMRMAGRYISRQSIIESVNNYEIIEENPKDKYLPSFLVYTTYDDEVIHILFATDVEGDNVRIVTSYYPKQEEWKEDLKTRRKRS
jgi:hypothetical protein